MEHLRAWLLTVIVCAVLVSLSDQLTPEGAVRGAVRFCGGLLLTVAFLYPITGALPELTEWSFPDSQALQGEYQKQYEQSAAQSIAEKTEAYIEDKAAELGITVRAKVQVQDGLPQSVTLYGEKNETLARQIEEDLAIRRSAQEWREAT